MLKKMEQAKKKAEAVVNTVDISEREKMAQLKRYDATVVEVEPHRLWPNPSLKLSLLVYKCNSVHAVPFSSLFCQYLQESGAGKGEERGDICRYQKGRR